MGMLGNVPCQYFDRIGKSCTHPKHKLFFGLVPGDCVCLSLSHCPDMTPNKSPNIRPPTQTSKIEHIQIQHSC